MLLAVMVLAGGSPATAAITRLGTYLQLGSGAIGELHPDVAFDDKHNVYLTVWGDGGTGKDRPVWAQLVTAGGALVGPKLRLTGCGTGVEVYGQKPRVEYTGGTTDDAFVVTYREWCGGKVTQWAQLLRYSAGGVVSIARTAIRSAGNPGGVAFNSARKEFVAVWEEVGSGYDVWYRAIRLSRDGNGAVNGFGTLPAAAPVSNAGKTQGVPRIAFDPSSQSYFIVFQGEDPSSSSFALMAKTMDGDSYALSSLLYVTKGGYPIESDVIYLPSVTNFAVFWRNSGDIVGRRFTPVSGAATTGIYPVIARPGTDGATGAGFDPGANVGMVAGMNSDYTVWASEISSSGALVSTFKGSTAPPSTSGGGTFFPKVAGTGSGSLGMVYGLNYSKVYIERFSATGGAAPPPPPPSPPPSCTISIAPTGTVNAPAGGGSGTIAVTVTNGPCSWSATSSASWLTRAPASGTASATVTWTAAANGTGASRSATLTIGSQSVTVSQGVAVTTLQIDGAGGGDFLAYDDDSGGWSMHLGNSTSFADGISGQWNAGWQIKPARFNTDGLTDFFYYNPSTGAWRKGINNGGSLSIYTPSSGWAAGWSTTVVDLNGDGLSDVFLYNAVTGNWFRCISSAGATDFTYYPGSIKWAAGWRVYAAKFNADNYGDLFLYNTSGATAGLWFKVLSQANGSFTFVASDLRWAANWQVVPGDFNKDGLTDLVLYRTSDGQAFRVTFTAKSATYVGAKWNTTWSLKKGEFNGDGRSDLFIYNASSGDWKVASANAAGWFDFYGGNIGAGSGYVPHPGHIDPDSKTDVLWYRPATGETTVWHSTAPGFNVNAGPTIDPDRTIILGTPAVP